MNEPKKHSKAYWTWRKVCGFFKYDLPRTFQYLYHLPRNYYLVKKYPFLKPSCGWGVDMEYCRPGYKYHYEETWLDGLPSGWRKVFGKQICDDLKAAIERGHLTNYAIRQVKEKYGTLCWYDEGGNNETRAIKEKYEILSEQICKCCGGPADYVTKGWIGFYCGHCVKNFKEGTYKKLGICDRV